MLNREDFLRVVRDAPLLSFDLVVREPSGQVLVGLRNNAPARGSWFVPGGVVRKNERFEAAFRRISTTELGVTLALGDARFLGPYEHFYEDNFAAANGVGTHYVVLAWEVHVAARLNGLPGDQHSGYRWVSVAELATEASIHPNTRAYAAALERIEPKE